DWQQGRSIHHLTNPHSLKFVITRISPSANSCLRECPNFGRNPACFYNQLSDLYSGSQSGRFLCKQKYSSSARDLSERIPRGISLPSLPSLSMSYPTTIRTYDWTYLPCFHTLKHNALIHVAYVRFGHPHALHPYQS